MRNFTTLTSRVVPLVVDNIDTDQIIPARFLKTTGKAGLGAVLFCDWRYEDEVPDLEAAGRAKAKIDFVLNDPQYEGAQILLAGDNFGCGSSREHAPLAIQASGISCVIAASFARIFFRNAINTGLPLLESREAAAGTEDGDELEVDLAMRTVRDITNGSQLTFGKIPEVMLHILDEGGLIPYIKKYSDFRL